MSYLVSIQRLKAILDSVSSSILPVKFQYVESMPTSFPAAMIAFQSSTEKELDTSTNVVDSVYAVSVIFPTEERQQATEKWMALLDAVSAAFRDEANQTLSNNAVRFMIGQTQSSITTDYGQPVIVFTLIANVRFIKSI